MKIKKIISLVLAMFMIVVLLPTDIIYAAADDIEMIDEAETAGYMVPEVDDIDLNGSYVDMSPDLETDADLPADEYNTGLTNEYENSLTPDGEDEDEIVSRIENIPKADGGYVYVGGIKWRIIGMGKNNKWLLISEDVLDGTKTMDDAESYCNTVYDTFSDAEKTIVNLTFKEDDQYPGYIRVNLYNEKLFLLSVSELYTYFSDNNDRKAGNNLGWWSRSFDSNNRDPQGGYSAALVVEKEGYMTLGTMKSDKYHGARPAFVLDLSSVLFTSAAPAGKPKAVAGSNEFRDFDDGMSQGGVKKLTLHDSSRDGFFANVGGSGVASVNAGDRLTIYYRGAVSNETVSAMLCTSDGKAVGYASMVPASAAGIWQLSLPDDLDCSEEYVLKVFSEKQNGSDNDGNPLTDYASRMIEIPLFPSVKKEKTPKAYFRAYGADSGFLLGLVPGVQYYISGAGIDETEVTADEEGTYELNEGLSAGDLSVVKKGTGKNLDSDAQSVTITKATAPSELGKTDCTNTLNNDGKITGVDTTMRYRKVGSGGWRSCTGNEITGLTDGKYLIQRKTSGSMLASDPVEVIIEKYVPETVAPPAFTPAAGTYTTAQNVTLKCVTSGAKIYYTTDGSKPTTGSKLYNGAIKVSDTTTIKAIAIKDGMTDSQVTTATYTIKKAEPKPEKISIKGATINLSKITLKYNGKEQKPAVKSVILNGKTLSSKTDYDIKWSNSKSKKLGTYTVTITGKGNYKDSKTATYEIVKGDNTLTVKLVKSTIKVPFKKLQEGKQTISRSEYLKVSKNQGKVTYKKTDGNEKITIEKKTGKITVKKGLKKGTYEVTVKVKAAGSKNYRSATKTVKFTVKVKK